MDESSSTALARRRRARTESLEVKKEMPQVPVGFGLFGLIRGIIGVAIAVAFIWLIYKLGKLIDAYTTNLKGKR